MQRNKLNVAYVLWKFPQYSQTFVYNEMEFLQDQFPEINPLVFAVRRAKSTVVHESVERFQRDHVSSPPLFAPKCILRVVFFVLRHPLKTLRLKLLLFKEIPIKISLKVSVYYVFQAIFCLVKGIYFANEFTKKKVRHIRTHFAESTGLIAYIASRLTGIPYSLTLHGHDIYDNPNHRLIKFLIKSSSFSVTVSQFNKRHLQGIDPTLGDKIFVIHCGIDPRFFGDVHSTKPDRFLILVVARLIKSKGIDVLVRACSILPPEMDYRCVIVGDGPERTRLERLVRDLGVADHFRFRGVVPQREVLAELRRTSVVVLPTYTEGIPVSLMEAMAMGVPVISSNIKGIPELVKDGAGILIQPGNPEELRDSLLNIARRSEQERIKMGSRGREIIKQEFDIRKQVHLLHRHIVANLST